jgi:hypothetical protein
MWPNPTAAKKPVADKRWKEHDWLSAAVRRIGRITSTFIELGNNYRMGFDAQKIASAHPIGKHSRATLQAR